MEVSLASAGATAEKPATEPSKENRENTPQEAAQTAAPEKPPVEPAEKAAPAKPSSDSDAIKTEFEDALDAARELVMPATTPASEAPPAPEPDMNYAHAVPQPPKANAAPSPASAPRPAEPEKATVEPVKPDAPQQQNMTAEDLIADFDRVLEAEMSKSEADQLPPTAAKKPQTEETPEAGASLEDEMKKLLGDLSAKQ